MFAVVPKRTSTGLNKVSIYEPEGDFKTTISHDFCNKCTWFTNSVRITDEAMTYEGGNNYSVSRDYVIDLTHGKVTDEDKISSSYTLIIKSSGTELVEGDDYTFDYVTGVCTFVNFPSSPTATYSYATDSIFIVAPPEGKVLALKHAEIQFSKNVVISPIAFSIYGYNPNDLPNKIPYEEVKYKNVKDIINISNLGYTVPAFGGLSNDIVILPFNYSRVISLKSSYGLEIRLKIDNDVPYSGEFSSVSFYTFVEDEV